MDGAAALWFARAGWPVFPASPNTKRPLLKGHGFKDASRDPSAIGGIWGRYPNAMVAVPTGKPIGHFVLDLDPANNPELPTWQLMLADIEARIGVALPRSSLEVETPRGGLHMYFRMPDGMDVRNTTGLWLWKGEDRGHKLVGVDVRGDGGYVVVPPSVRRGPQAVEEGCDGKAYNWIKSRPAGLVGAEAPPELLEHVRHVEEEVAPSPPPLPPSSGGSSSAGSGETPQEKFAEMALWGEVEKVRNAPKGQRNQTLNNAALALGGLGAHGLLTFSRVEAQLLSAAADCGLVKGDGIKACQATIRSGWAAGLQRPRDLSHVGTRASGGAGSGGGAMRPMAPIEGIEADDRAVRSRGRGDDDGDAGGGGGDDGDGGGADGGGGGEDGRDKAETARIIAENTKEPLNDLGNAARMLRWFGSDMLIVRDVGEHIWTGSHWATDGAEDYFQRFAQKTGERIRLEAIWLKAMPKEREILDLAAAAEKKAEADRDADDIEAMVEAKRIAMRVNKMRGGRLKFAVQAGNSAKIVGMQSQIKPMITVSQDAMDADPMAINAMNGTLRLAETFDPDDDGKPTISLRLDPHRRSDKIAKVLGAAYDPAARAPKWDAFLEQMQPKPAIRRFLQQWSGISLTGRVMQHFVFHYGGGANGKSVFTETLARVVGSYCKSLPAEAVTGDMQRRGDQATPEFARLPGARMIRIAELQRGQAIKESVIKLLTGGEPMTVRHLHQDFFEFWPRGKASASGNDKPPITGVDEGIWRRMKLVPWEVHVAEGDRRDFEEMVTDLMTEASGILNWALAGLLDFTRGGLVIPDEIRAATDDYRDEMDPVGSFINACVKTERDNRVTARVMFKSYEAWCHANSVKRFAESTFARIMGQKGMKKTNGRIREYLDVILHDVPEDPDARGGHQGELGEADAWRAPSGYDH